VCVRERERGVCSGYRADSRQRSMSRTAAGPSGSFVSYRGLSSIYICIRIYTYIYIYIRCNIYVHTHTHTHTNVYILLLDVAAIYMYRRCCISIQ
jgi:hypothetical protein